jgi:hypothetical protein
MMKKMKNRKRKLVDIYATTKAILPTIGREPQSPTSSISAAPAGTGTEVATTNHLATVVEQQNFPLQVFELEEESLFDTTDLIFDGLCEQLLSLHSMNPIPKLSQFSSAQAEEVVELAVNAMLEKYTFSVPSLLQMQLDLMTGGVNSEFYHFFLERIL